jgi:hypothetical protein
MTGRGSTQVGVGALERLTQAARPAASVVSKLFGTWAAARAVASCHAGAGGPATTGESSSS